MEKKRLPTNYNLIENLEYIDPEDLLSIELGAAVLELDECYESLFIEPDMLSEYETTLCKKAHRRGRKIAIRKAGQNLFAQMSQRNGASACLDYLKQMSGTFSAEIAPTSSGSGFVFNVNMPGDD